MRPVLSARCPAASPPLPVDFSFLIDTGRFYSMIIAGGCMFVIGTFLTIVPMIRLAVGPVLFATGGLICLIGVMLK
jgi:hypothetical protein